MDTLLLSVFDRTEEVNKGCSYLYLLLTIFIGLGSGVLGLVWGSLSWRWRIMILMTSLVVVVSDLVAGYGIVRFAPIQTSFLHSLAGVFAFYVIVVGLWITPAWIIHSLRRDARHFEEIQARLGTRNRSRT